MADAPQFYKTVVPLNREQHRDLKLASPKRPYDFASATHMVTALAEEFGPASRHLPIVCLPGATQMTPVFLLGARPGLNSFIDKEGHWIGGYVPAYLRRYPFIVGEIEGADPVVCIDETSERLSREGGEALFDEAGADTPLLAERVKLTTDYFATAKRTEEMASAVQSLDLLHPITIEVKRDGQQASAMHGLFAVDEARLAALPDDKFLDLRRQGFLGPIYAHLISLSAVDKLTLPEGTLPNP